MKVRVEEDTWWEDGKMMKGQKRKIREKSWTTWWENEERERKIREKSCSLTSSGSCLIPSRS
jgi:hypothetical protein